MSDAEEFVGSGGHVKVGGLLVGEKGVWNPDALEVFGADHEPLDVGQRREDQTRIPPVLAEVDVRREILRFPGFFFNSMISIQRRNLLRTTNFLLPRTYHLHFGN